MIIDGKKVSAEVRSELRKDVTDFIDQTSHTPGLAVIIVGSDPASAVYVRNKHRACEELGMYSEVIELSENTTERELLDRIEILNSRSDIDGILVQLPLPRHIDTDKVIAAISPDKDVDGFHPANVGKLLLGQDTFVSCTPAGVMKLLDNYSIPVEGKHCVIVGRSNIVGKPLAQLMITRSATVTVCHSRTVDLASYTRQADILVVAVGRAGLVGPDMVKPGAIVIDVGINRNSDGKLCGDVCTDAVSPIASAITPVPGGVGPMTITMLMENTLKAACKHCGLTN